MKLLVCIKPDCTGQEIGPFELLALEAALGLKEEGEQKGWPKIRVDVATAGPESWGESLVRALGTGADQGIHILTPQGGGSDYPGLLPAASVAGMLAGALSSNSYDLILTGVMSQDLMAGQTGPMLARMLGLPCATAVVSLTFQGQDCLSALREMEGGVQENLSIPLPALVSVQSGVYTPRYPVLSHMLKAREKPVRTISPASLPAPAEIFGAPVLPELTREGQAAGGSLEAQIAAFNHFLRKRGLV